MKLATVLEQILGDQRGATTNEIRDIFGDYHNLLRWLAAFLMADEKLADACMVDACTIAETHTPEFHEWLVHWAARATVRCALQTQRSRVAELAPKYEHSEPVHPTHPPLSRKQLLMLVKNSDDIQARLNVLCRFVLVLRGIAKDSCDEVATQLSISRGAVEQAYCVAYDVTASDSALCGADVPARPTDRERALAESAAAVPAEA